MKTEMAFVTDEQIAELLDEIYEIGLAKPEEQIAAVRAFAVRVADADRAQSTMHELLKKVAAETWGLAVEEGYYGDIQPRVLPDDMAEKIIQNVLTEMRGHLKDG